MTEKPKSTGCCPPFDPTPWDEKELNWKNKLFVQDNYIQFMHIPLNLGKKLVKNVKKMEAAGAIPEPFIFLADEKSMWKSNMFLSATKEVPGCKIVKFNGTFLSKVFEGPYQDAPKWMKEMEKYVKSKDKEIKEMYFFYTTCPKCAKAYGKNYVAILVKTD